MDGFPLGTLLTLKTNQIIDVCPSICLHTSIVSQCDLCIAVNNIFALMANDFSLLEIQAFQLSPSLNFRKHID